MNAMMSWASADLIRYDIAGVYEGTAGIASNHRGLADVTDRVEIELKWKLSEMKLVGTPSIRNTKSVLRNLRDNEPSCLPPLLKGEYEHYELLEIKEGLAGQLDLRVQTTHPEVEIAQFCTAGRKAVPAGQETRQETFSLPSPVMFAMPIANSDQLSISKDRKSFIKKDKGWTWTFTPHAVQAQ